MTELKTVIETEDLIKKILSKRNKEIADITEKIETAKQNATKAEKETSEAILTGDLKTYQTAKAKKKDADDAVEMYTEMLDALQNKSLVNKKEYYDTVNRIINEVQKIIDSGKVEIVKHVEAMNELGQNYQDLLNQANKVLRDWQYKIGCIDPHDFDETGHQNGLTEIDDWEIPEFVKQISDSEFYKQIKTETEFINTNK